MHPPPAWGRGGTGGGVKISEKILLGGGPGVVRHFNFGGGGGARGREGT